ncbi:MAG: helicase-related protein, partial [Acidobacteriota bacterium]
VGRSPRPKEVIVDPSDAERPHPDVQLDWVGSLKNAARLVAGLHRGEKRMVFCDSRARTEELVHDLGVNGVDAHISHSSLSRELRSFSEEAFTRAAEGVIVATSTLELGIDLGDLDRVLQIDAPSRVANFLQRLGRTGRRSGTRANCLFLATHEQAFLRAAGLLQLWSEGYVEPVTPPPRPFHVLAQQLMALCLQTGGASDDDLKALLLSYPLSALDVEKVLAALDSLYERGILFKDAGKTWLGAEGERRFQRRQFMDLLSMITDSPLFTVLHGQKELGQVDRASLLVEQEGPTVLLLAGRSWRVENIDWRRKRCWVKAVEDRGKSRWLGEGPPLGFELCQAIRRVLAGDSTPPGLTRRGADKLEELRSEFAWLSASDAGSFFETLDASRVRWWTFAGLLGNASLLGWLDFELEKPPPFDSLSMTFPKDLADRVRERLTSSPANTGNIQPFLSERALETLKFAECLPPPLVNEAVSSRWADVPAAKAVTETPFAVVMPDL